MERETSVLIVDDDPDARALVSGALTMLGLAVSEAASAHEALSMFSTLRPDLVVLDYMMPDGDGITVCKSMKSHHEGRYVPVLMLTARDGVRDKVTALDGGADDYLTKPFHYQELQARSRSLLRMRELNLQLRSSNEELRRAQEKLIRQERQLLTHQLAGTAAHALGQPLSAITLNCHLLERLDPSDPRAATALLAIRADAKRMGEIIERLQGLDSQATEPYDHSSSILAIEGKEPPK